MPNDPDRRSSAGVEKGGAEDPDPHQYLCAYAKGALMKLPSLEDHGQRAAEKVETAARNLRR